MDEVKAGVCKNRRVIMRSLCLAPILANREMAIVRKRTVVILVKFADIVLLKRLKAVFSQRNCLIRVRERHKKRVFCSKRLQKEPASPFTPFIYTTRHALAATHLISVNLDWFDAKQWETPTVIDRFAWEQSGF